ncbi:hypothetical protein KSB_67180 [Ktedonobacter robiniae]|uniref:Uncharacterized protein n=1 Tax=Ktedonobacter robiniae TaxID=2778365 RepID=A0ABQ3UZL7_9CHLR|nr:hypothetical protein KSB_67180 [Ktedonobacter robiniae]
MRGPHRRSRMRVYHQFYRSLCRKKRPYKKQEQDPTDQKRGPTRPAQNMVEQIEMSFLLSSYSS